MNIKISEHEIDSLYWLLDMFETAYPNMGDKDGFSDKERDTYETVKKLYDKIKNKQNNKTKPNKPGF